MTTVDDLLMGGRKAKAAFNRTTPVGYTVKGTVTEKPEARQCTDYDTDELLFWDAAKTQPKMQVVIKLATDERDPADPDDEGIRAVYAPQSSRTQKAIRDAVTKSGAKTIEVGGTLAVKFTGLGEPVKLQSGKLGNPPKLYAAEYKPPAAPSAADSLLGAGQDEQPPF